MIEFLKNALGALIGLGFIYIIVLRLFSNFNNIKRALVAFIVGLIQTIIIVVGIKIDGYNLSFNLKNLWYYAFLIVSILLMLVIPLIYLIIGKTRHQQFRNYHIKIKQQQQKSKPTIKEKDEYVYYVFKCKDNYLLKTKHINGEKFYYSEQDRLNKILFHDEMIKSIIDKYGLNEFNPENVISSNQIGEALVKGKKDKHYYCYLIELNDMVSSLNEYELISPYDLFRYNMEDFDKRLLFYIILKEPFKIEIE